MYLSNNSYRVLGVVSNASLKDIHKNISKLKAFAKIGKQMDLDYNLSCLNLCDLNRTDALLMKSESQIKLDKNRIQNSLFWFIDTSPIDSVALSHLIKGGVEKSIEIWDKAIKSNEVSSKNFSAYSNLSTLLLLSSLDDTKTDKFKKDIDSINKIKRALELKKELITSTYFDQYCDLISKSKPLTSDEAHDFYTSTVIDILNKNYIAKEMSKLFEGLDNQLVDSLTESLTDAPISNIKNHISISSKKIENDEKSGVKVGKQLIRDTLSDFKQLKDVLSVDDFKLQTISDALANQILQCGIVCFNATGDDQEYLSSYKYALQIAIGEKTKNRAKDCIKHCEEIIDARVCKFCGVNHISANSSFRVKLHKMKYNREYSYFQNGGFQVSCCSICSPGIKFKKTASAILGLAIYAGFMVLTQGVLLVIEIIFTRFMIYKWFTKFIRKIMFFDNIAHHPDIKKLQSDGYVYGMP